MIFEEKLTFDDVQIVPGFSNIESRKDVNTSTQFTKNFTIDIPLVAAPMDSVCGEAMMAALLELGAVGCLHRFMSIEEQVKIIQSVLKWVVGQRRAKNSHNIENKIVYNPPIVASIGATGDYMARAEHLLNAGANVLLIDVAHGDHLHVKIAMNFLNSLCNRNSFDVILGNIATADAAKRLEDWGADALRVGIGGGSMCETRVRTGVGIPQLSAILDVMEVANVPVISDGGIKLPGDVCKALGAGASSVMLGSLFSGTIESPGDIFETGQWPNVKKMKVFRGSASAASKFAIKGSADYIEGTATMIPVKGSVSNVISTIMDGVRSSMSYVGVKSLDQYSAKTKFIRITNAGLAEAHPHGLR